MATVNITDENFEAEVLKAGKPVLVDFWAEWCRQPPYLFDKGVQCHKKSGPCKQIGPTLEEISDENSNIVIAKMNTDENPTISSQHGIMSIPTMMIFKNGQLVDRLVGALPKPAILEKIEAHL